MDTLFLLLGLGLILGGAHLLTDGAAALAQRFRVPEFIIGLTVIAIGTSTPELVVSLLSALGGKSDMAIGNVVGSNLFNTLVIVGVCTLIRPLPLSRENIRRDIPFGVIASLLLLAFASRGLLHPGDGRINRSEGLIMLLLYAGLMIYTVRAAIRSGAVTNEKAQPAKNMWITLLMIVGGLAGLIYGGDLFLDRATSIARKWGISESVISITLVAGGTSLPELASSVVSIIKGKTEMALGNVLGSNIANILLILGLSATIRPLDTDGITAADLGMVVLGSLLLLMAAFTFRRGKADRWEGALFLAIYAVYIGYLIR